MWSSSQFLILNLCFLSDFWTWLWWGKPMSSRLINLILWIFKFKMQFVLKYLQKVITKLRCNHRCDILKEICQHHHSNAYSKLNGFVHFYNACKYICILWFSIFMYVLVSARVHFFSVAVIMLYLVFRMRSVDKTLMFWSFAKISQGLFLSCALSVRR